MTSTPIVSRETCRLRRTPVVSRETTGVFTARRVDATRFRWAMSSHDRSSAATTPPQRQQRTQQPASPTSRPAHETVFTLKGRHQRGHSSARHYPPIAHSTTGQRVPPHAPGPGNRPPMATESAPTNEGQPSAEDTHQQGRPPTSALRHRPRQLRAADTPRGTPRLAARARASAPWRGAKTQARAKKAMSTRTIVAPVGTSMDHER